MERAPVGGALTCPYDARAREEHHALRRREHDGHPQASPCELVDCAADEIFVGRLNHPERVRLAWSASPRRARSRARRSACEAGHHHGSRRRAGFFIRCAVHAQPLLGGLVWARHRSREDVAAAPTPELLAQDVLCVHLDADGHVPEFRAPGEALPESIWRNTAGNRVQHIGGRNSCIGPAGMRVLVRIGLREDSAANHGDVMSRFLVNPWAIRRRASSREGVGIRGSPVARIVALPGRSTRIVWSWRSEATSAWVARGGRGSPALAGAFLRSEPTCGLATRRTDACRSLAALLSRCGTGKRVADRRRGTCRCFLHWGTRRRRRKASPNESGNRTRGTKDSGDGEGRRRSPGPILKPGRGMVIACPEDAAPRHVAEAPPFPLSTP